MFSTKLITTLKLVAKRGKELDNLRKFIHSDFHHIDNAVVKIFDTWDKKYKNDFALLDNEKIWADIFPEKKLNDNVMRAYCSTLTTLVEQFFVQEELKKDKILQKKLLAKAYEGKKQTIIPDKNELENTKATEQQAAKKEAVILSIYKELENLIEAKLLSSEKFKALLFLKEKGFHNFEGKNIDKKNNTATEYLKALDEFYFIQKLKFLNVELTKGKIYQAKTSVLLQEEVLDLSQKSDNPLIKIYGQLILLFDDDDSTATHYNKIKTFFDEHKEKFEEEEKLFIYIQLKNYLIRKSNQGEEWIRKPLFDFYKETLQSPISELSFQNMVAVACLANELDYCDEFITNQSKDIKGKNKDVLEKLARANLHFYRYLNDKESKHLDTVLEVNKNIETLKGDLTYNLSLRVVLCKTYFELSKSKDNDKDSTSVELTNLSQYIRKQKLAQEKREPNLNFCKYLQLIINNATIKEELAKIKEELKEKKVVNREWLMAQCEKGK